MTFKEKKEIEKKKEELTEEVKNMVYNNPDNFIKDLWDLVISAENKATTIEHSECYQFYTKKKDLNEEYEEQITKEDIELKEKFLEIIKKYSKGKENDN